MESFLNTLTGAGMLTLIEAVKFLGVFIVGMFLVSVVRNNLYSIVARIFGRRLVLALSFPGVCCHEISHSIFAILFGHSVTKISLFSFNPNTLEMGYVEHKYNGRNYIHRLGCFFIGFAPLILNPVAVFFILHFFSNGQLVSPIEAVQGMDDGPIGFIAYEYFVSSYFAIINILASVFSQNFLMGIALVYVLVSLSLHCVPSRPDLKGSLTGVWVILGLLFLLGFTYFGLINLISADNAIKYVELVLIGFTYLEVTLFLSITIALIMASFGLAWFFGIAVVAWLYRFSKRRYFGKRPEDHLEY